jgi:peptidoglycan hydrolase-like protein with peptidoglycan-binding domain
LVFQEAGMLYGCEDDQAKPAKADAYTGAWKTDVERRGKRISVDEAAATVGGIVLRYPPGPGKMGHIALCDGKGGTVEAKGRRYGVVADTVHGREWHTGVLIPGITYESGSAMKVALPEIVYEPNAQNMNKEIVVKIQEALKTRGFSPGIIDGDYGPNTQQAVTHFQEAEGLVVDGAVGPETAAALGVSFLAEKKAPMPEREFENRGIFPPELRQEALAGNPLQLLTLVLMMLSKEKPMANDPAKAGQGFDNVSLLLPLLLQSALTGKQIDTAELLTVLLTGKPIASPPTPTPTPSPQPQPQPSPQMPVDFVTLLLPLVYERLTGKPWPGTAPAEPQKKPDAPEMPTQPALSRPSVQLSAAGLGISTILQALGIVGTPFGVGGTNATSVGTLATLIPLVTGAFGATGGFGALLNAGRGLLGGLANAAGKPK